jgi:hypothetical protein
MREDNTECWQVVSAQGATKGERVRNDPSVAVSLETPAHTGCQHAAVAYLARSSLRTLPKVSK